jgi:hypothetical protein
MLAAPLCLAPLALAAQGAPSGDWIIPAGTVAIYDTLAGPALVNRLVIEPGATLRITGARPFVVVATQEIQVDGALDASGFDAKPVFTLFTPNQAEIGAHGAAGGGPGGTGSPLWHASPKGGDGFAFVPGLGIAPFGGRGGETGDGLLSGAGGGGGAFGPDVPGGGAGLVATSGGDGHPRGKGALSGGAAPAQGGMPGPGAFRDADPANDFWGRKRDPLTGSLIVGELAAPRPGAGGGAGGDAIAGGVFPPVLSGGFYDNSGAGGGGGGGLVTLLSARIGVGATGAIRIDGGIGNTGENVLGFGHIAGSSGGGSGGMLILEADLVDLSSAGADALSALGGIGGADDGDAYPGSLSGGGHGGPGVFQIHVQNAAQDLLLPAGPTGMGLSDLSAPDAHVCLPAL